jgi:hypothetical protein
VMLLPKLDMLCPSQRLRKLRFDQRDPPEAPVE